MADNLSSERDALLCPRHLVTARDLLMDRSLVPDVGGIYGWWFDCRVANAPLEGTLIKDGYRLLYVGIAPRKPSAAGSESKSTLRKRITRNHLGNRIGSSTLRRSLAWLLSDELSLCITQPGKKQVMAREHEDRLTQWMAEHAAVSFLVNPEPWSIEDELIATGPALPLNVKGSAHPFSQVLSQLRSSNMIEQAKISRRRGR